MAARTPAKPDAAPFVVHTQGTSATIAIPIHQLGRRGQAYLTH